MSQGQSSRDDTLLNSICFIHVAYLSLATILKQEPLHRAPAPNLFTEIIFSLFELHWGKESDGDEVSKNHQKPDMNNIPGKAIKLCQQCLLDWISSWWLCPLVYFLWKQTLLAQCVKRCWSEVRPPGTVSLRGWWKNQRLLLLFTQTALSLFFPQRRENVTLCEKYCSLASAVHCFTLICFALFSF